MDPLKRTYLNYVSLGFFCSIAIDLKKLSLRNCSYPFDWTISDFKSNCYLVNTKFKEFLQYKRLFQHQKYNNYYFCKSSNTWFFHDFDANIPAILLYFFIKRKYKRRIKRFLKLDKNKTLFIRYIKDVEEIIFISSNMNLIHALFPNIIYICNNELKEHCTKIENIYFVNKDINDSVNRTPLISEKNLYNYFKNIPKQTNSKIKKHILFKIYYKFLKIIYRKPYQFKKIDK